MIAPFLHGPSEIGLSLVVVGQGVGQTGVATSRRAAGSHRGPAGAAVVTDQDAIAIAPLRFCGVGRDVGAPVR